VLFVHSGCHLEVDFSIGLSSTTLRASLWAAPCGKFRLWIFFFCCCFSRTQQARFCLFVISVVGSLLLFRAKILILSLIFPALDILARYLGLLVPRSRSGLFCRSIRFSLLFGAGFSGCITARVFTAASSLLPFSSRELAFLLAVLFVRAGTHRLGFIRARLVCPGLWSCLLASCCCSVCSLDFRQRFDLFCVVLCCG
jgi:hypothetical protein